VNAEAPKLKLLKCVPETAELLNPIARPREPLSEVPPKCEPAMFEAARLGETADPEATDGP
jgi:hypothetical protein